MSRSCCLGVLPKLGLNELWWQIHKGGGVKGMGRCVRRCRAIGGAQDEGAGNVNQVDGGRWCLTSSDLCRQERDGWGRIAGHEADGVNERGRKLAARA